MRFTLVDKILQLEAGKSITAIKNLSLAEEYLQDHFPGFPVMPGVLMIEALVQAGAWLMRYTDDFAYSTVLLKQTRAVKFNNFVSPGKTLNIHVELKSSDAESCVLQGLGTVDGGTAVSAKLTLEKFNLADKNPEMKRIDDLQIQKLKELFTVLWDPNQVAASA